MSDRYLAKDRHGRGYGRKIGTTGQDQLDAIKLKEKEDMTAVSDFANIAKTALGGMNLISLIKEKGMKDVLLKKINPLNKLKEGLNVFEKIDRGPGFLKNFLPDMRDIGDKYGLSSDFTQYFESLDPSGQAEMEEKLFSLFDDEQLERINAKNLLGYFNKER